MVYISFTHSLLHGLEVKYLDSVAKKSKYTFGKTHACAIILPSKTHVLALHRKFLRHPLKEIKYQKFTFTYSATCQPIVGLRNRALLGSRPLNASWPSMRCAAVREAVSSRAMPWRAKPHRALLHSRPRWRHTAACSLPRQRRCKHGDLTQQSWLPPVFI
jgi:hypothetical protein